MRAEAFGVLHKASIGRFWLLAVAVLAALLGVSFEQIPDPLIRHDDFEALFGDGGGYYHKTLYEGRWLNYLWIEYGPQWSAQINYIVYFAAWAIYTAGFVHLALPKAEVWRQLCCAVIIGACPPLLLISPWFNTLVPAVFVLALYAILAVHLSERAARRLLVIFVPLALTGYTTFPFFLLAICLCRADAPRSLRHLAKLLALFILSFALGMALIYGLNWLFHGVFGVPMATWRNPSPAEDWAGLWGNLQNVMADIAAAADVFVFDITPALWVLGGFTLWTLLVLLRRAPGRLVYLLSGLGVGMALILLQAARSGIELPPRVLGFGFVFLGFMWALMSMQLSDAGHATRRLADKALPLLALFFALSGAMQNHWSVTWQADSRAMAAVLQEAGHGPTTEVYVTGDLMGLESAQKAHLQKPRALRLRLKQLTGMDVTLCAEDPVACADLAPIVPAAMQPGDWQVVQDGGALILHLPSPAS